MRDDPGLDGSAIAATLSKDYGIHVVGLTFLPIGFDPVAYCYRVDAANGRRFFLKVRNAPVNRLGLEVPHALIARGIPHILAPLPANNGALAMPIEKLPGCSAMVYPFLDGVDAAVAGLSDEQWRIFGRTLRAVHDSGSVDPSAGRLPIENFDLPSAALVRRMLVVERPTVHASSVAEAVAAFWRANRVRTEEVLRQAEVLGARLRAKSFARVLCHADIHAANVLVGEDGEIWLIDWDGPLAAPRERDLLFVIGSQIARRVESWEEERFFEGYGAIEIDPEALAYFRYERAIEDIGIFAERVLLDPSLSEPIRAAEANLGMSFYAPGGDLDAAEVVPRVRWD